MVSRVLNLIWKEVIQWRRGWPLLLIALLVPVFEMVCMAYALSAGVKHLPTAVYDQDTSPESRAVIAALRESGCFAPDIHVASMPDLERLLDKGTVQAGLVISKGFGRQLRRPGEEVRPSPERWARRYWSPSFSTPWA